MIVHVVLFSFKEDEKISNIKKAKEMLSALRDNVPSLKYIEIGENFCSEGRAMDLSIVTRFNTKEDLNEYAVHPEHLKVVDFIKQVVEYSKVVDYETL